MIYVFGISGFVFGFFLGQGLLMIWLKDRSNREILENKSLRWRYGLFNWGIAGLSSYIFLVVYRLIVDVPKISP